MLSNWKKRIYQRNILSVFVRAGNVPFQAFADWNRFDFRARLIGATFFKWSFFLCGGVISWILSGIINNKVSLTISAIFLAELKRPFQLIINSMVLLPCILTRAITCPSQQWIINTSITEIITSLKLICNPIWSLSWNHLHYKFILCTLNCHNKILARIQSNGGVIRTISLGYCFHGNDCIFIWEGNSLLLTAIWL